MVRSGLASLPRLLFSAISGRRRLISIAAAITVAWRPIGHRRQSSWNCPAGAGKRIASPRGKCDDIAFFFTIACGKRFRRRHARAAFCLGRLLKARLIGGIGGAERH
jgi:hypothetical protein